MHEKVTPKFVMPEEFAGLLALSITDATNEFTKAVNNLPTGDKDAWYAALAGLNFLHQKGKLQYDAYDKLTTQILEGMLASKHPKED